MAGIVDQFPYLPGHLVEFLDGGLKIKSDPTPPTTESILILGTAMDGPVNTPVSVDPSSAELIFGKSAATNGRSNGSTLMLAFEEAWAAGNRDVRLMRISGTKATGQIVATNQATNAETVGEEILGPSAGNEETVFTLADQAVVAESVSVFADGVELSEDDFVHTTEENLDEIITLAADVTNALAQITIQYQHVSGGDTYDAIATGTVDIDDVFTAFVAAGTDQVFTLDHEPDTIVVTADGVIIPASKYVLDDAELTIDAGAASMGAILVASYVYIDGEESTPAVLLESVFAGSIYTGTILRVENVLSSLDAVIGKKLFITKPLGKKASMSEKPMEFSSLDYITLADLVEAINADLRNNVVRATVANQYQEVLAATLSVSANITLTGGTDETKMNKAVIFEKLSGIRDEDGFITTQGAYQLLENYTVDYIVPYGVFHDDALAGGKSFSYELALACAVISHRNHVTHGVIATTSPSLPTLIEVDSHVEALLEVPVSFYMKDKDGVVITDNEGVKIDLGKFVSVLAAPDVRLTNTRVGSYAANSPAIYAAMVAGLPVKSSPLNKEVPGILGLRFAYGNSHLNKLTAASYVTYELKNNGTKVVVTDAPTGAAAGSDYKQITAFRAVKVAADQVRLACDPFRGESNDVANRNAMSSSIEKALAAMKSAGAIQGFEFRLISSLADQILGNAKIELTIVPPLVLRKITTVVSLAPTL